MLVWEPPVAKGSPIRVSRMRLEPSVERVQLLQMKRSWMSSEPSEYRTRCRPYDANTRVKRDPRKGKPSCTLPPVWRRRPRSWTM